MGGRPNGWKRELETMEIRIHLKIIGRVQGVGYRNWASCTAHSLGLKGWVKNCPDDNVEAEAQGPEEIVTEFVKACHQGPARAQVKEVKTKTLPDLGAYEDFEIKF